MADSATPETLDCSTKQKQLRIAKLKLPTLAAGSFKPKVKQSHICDDSWPIHFDLRSEADKAPKLPAPLFSNGIFRIRGSPGVQCSSTQLIQKPGFIPNNPLGMIAGLFSEIKQELAMEARKFSIIQSEYLKECIKRSRYPGIDNTIGAPETANTAGYQLKNNLSFLVRLLFEIMEGPEDIEFKAACDMPSLPDIYSTKESKAACETPSLPHSSVKQLTGASSYKNSPTSGFNSLFTIKRK